MSSIKIDRYSIKEGSNSFIELYIARLPSGTEIHLPIHIFRSKVKGPTILLSGGLHGDEVNGIEIVRRMVSGKSFTKLKCGSIIAMPIINIFGFLNFSRDVPDGKDVNRSFPGNESGSLASLVAYTISTHILPNIDFGIDFHTGGSSRTNFPQVRISDKDKLGQDVAQRFQAPYTLRSPLIEGSLRKCAFDMGKSIVVYEGGESMRFSETAIEEAIRGTYRVLHSFNMISGSSKPKKPTQFFNSSKWLRAEMAGLFRSLKKSGQKVNQGDVLGIISDVAGQYQISVDCPENGYIVGHNNTPVVHKGDALFHIGITD
jgi:predicted deacylase